jgi:hypothetical protein
VVSFTLPPLSPQKKNPWCPLDRRLGGPQSRSGRGGEEKNSQLELPIIQPVAQRCTTGLSLLSLQVFRPKFLMRFCVACYIPEGYNLIIRNHFLLISRNPTKDHDWCLFPAVSVSPSIYACAHFKQRLSSLTCYLKEVLHISYLNHNLTNSIEQSPS